MKNILQAIGNTPLIKIGKIFAKAEFLNPSGSIKDRMAKYMIEKAEREGKLKKGYVIIEATSGNTGISFAMISALKGYKFIAVMPKEGLKGIKAKIIEALGGKVIFVKGNREDVAMEKAKQLAKRYKHVWMPRQFENYANVEAQQEIGKEILRQIDKIDVFVAGIGTGGTLMGIGKILKKKFPKIKIFGVRPADSPHLIEGLIDKKEPLPKILDLNLIDGIIEVKTSKAIKMTKKIIRETGLLVGISSGANIFAAIKLAKKYKNVVTVLPDRTERYLSLLFKKIKIK